MATCMLFRIYLFPLVRWGQCSMQQLIQPWICTPGTHFGWMAQQSMECKVCQTLFTWPASGIKPQNFYSFIQCSILSQYFFHEVCFVDCFKPYKLNIPAHPRGGIDRPKTPEFDPYSAEAQVVVEWLLCASVWLTCMGISWSYVNS